MENFKVPAGFNLTENVDNAQVQKHFRKKWGHPHEVMKWTRTV